MSRILTKEQLSKFNKDDLIKQYLGLQSEYKAMSDSLSMQQKQIEELMLAVAELRRNQTEKLDADDSNLMNRVLTLERQSFSTQQYSRRDCIEFHGIPVTVTDEELEEKVCLILNSIDAPTTPEQIQACHRMKDKKRTIVKFVNRKSAFQALQKRLTLKDLDKSVLNMPSDTVIYLNESLCPYYRMLHGKCKMLWQQNKIFSFWVSNGNVRYRLREHGNFATVEHLEDLQKSFGEI